jgi:hypothetical protein
MGSCTWPPPRSRVTMMPIFAARQSAPLSSEKEQATLPSPEHGHQKVAVNVAPILTQPCPLTLCQIISGRFHLRQKPKAAILTWEPHQKIGGSCRHIDIFPNPVIFTENSSIKTIGSVNTENSGQSNSLFEYLFKL